VRAGAHGPVAGMLHAVFLLAFMLVAAPLARFIPLASLAGLLGVVAWNMVEKQAFANLLRASHGDAVVLLSTFLLTVFRDLTEGILVGFAIGTLLFLNRMSQAISVETDRRFSTEDRPDNDAETRTPYDATLATDRSLVIYRISGAFFFGAASTVAAVLDRIADRPKTFILDFSGVPFLDSTAANAIQGTVRRARRNGVTLILTGLRSPLGDVLAAHGVHAPDVRIAPTIEDALASHTRKSRA